jgi:hypothetical protein
MEGAREAYEALNQARARAAAATGS